MKLLVNPPMGGQQLIEVGDGGAYFDQSLVLWDEREDGPLPQITLGGMVREGDALALDSALLAANVAMTLFLAKATALKLIDADADAIYSAVIGNRATEYAQAEKDALQYEAQGFAGDVPSSVQSWATAKGWTAQAACNDILGTATAWRNAQAAIRSARLGKKEQAKASDTIVALSAVMAAWAGTVTAIRSQLGI